MSRAIEQFSKWYPTRNELWTPAAVRLCLKTLSLEISPGAVAGVQQYPGCRHGLDDEVIEVMKSYRKELWLEVPARRAFVNITPRVNECVRESGVREGLALVNSMHVTAAVFIDDDESGLYSHYEKWLERLAPVVAIDPSDEDTIGEDIIDAHMKRQLMGRQVVIAVTEGRLDFGHWENIFYGEFDGGRKKRVLVKIIGE